MVSNEMRDIITTTTTKEKSYEGSNSSPPPPPPPSITSLCWIFVVIASLFPQFWGLLYTFPKWLDVLVKKFMACLGLEGQWV